MNLPTQYHKTVSWNCKRSVALSQKHVGNILPYTVKIDSAHAVTTFLRIFRNTEKSEDARMEFKQYPWHVHE